MDTKTILNDASGRMQKAIDHLEEELNERGLPTWWPEQEPKDGELPISDVA